MAILGKQTTVKDTDILLYKCPAGKQSVLAVNAVNTGVQDGKVTISLLRDNDLSVNSVIVTNKGTGLTESHTISVVGENSSEAEVEVSTLQIVDLSSFIGGSNYEIGDVLTLEGGTFSTAATATVSAIDANGSVTALTSITGGSYSEVISDTTVTTTTDSAVGSGFTLDKTGLVYGIESVNIVNSGNGYKNIPTLEVDSGSGFGFTVAMAAKVEVTDAIEYNTDIFKEGTGLLERSGLVLGAGDQIFVGSTVSTINVIATGIETIA